MWNSGKVHSDADRIWQELKKKALQAIFSVLETGHSEKGYVKEIQ